jgi:hypothetical protein
MKNQIHKLQLDSLFSCIIVQMLADLWMEYSLPETGISTILKSDILVGWNSLEACKPGKNRNTSICEHN